MKDYIKKYKKTPQVVRDLAQSCGVERIYLTQIASGHGRPSAPLAVRLNQFSGGELDLNSLRSDIWLQNN